MKMLIASFCCCAYCDIISRCLFANIKICMHKRKLNNQIFHTNRFVGYLIWCKSSEVIQHIDKNAVVHFTLDYADH